MYFGPSHSTTCRPRRRHDPTIQRSPDSPVSRVGRTKQIVYITLPLSAQCDDATHLPLLDAQIPPAGAETASLVKGGQFPPLTPVFMCTRSLPKECRLLPCVAVTRQLFSMLRSAVDTAVVCHQLAQGNLPSCPPLTNHLDGWASIARLFHSFSRNGARIRTCFPRPLTSSSTRKRTSRATGRARAL
jgi:hypothetical protein